MKLEEYETKYSDWKEEFEKSYVEWVDLELIQALLNSIECSVRFFCNAINDTTRWPAKINKSLKTVSYPRIRDAADFLGIPPWLLFYHKEKNLKIKELFERIRTIHKPIELPYFSEYNEFYAYFYDELSNRVPKDDLESISGKLLSLLGQKQYHDVVEGNWKAVISYFKDIHREFSGGATFSYRDPNDIISGNIRLSFRPHPKNERTLIKSGWLSFTIDPTKTTNSTTINLLTSKIISDMEWIFEHSPFIFKSELDGKQVYLFSWHSLRSSNTQYDAIQSLINRKLPEANFSMNITEKTLSAFSSSPTTTNPFEEFIRIIQEDVPAQSKPINTRGQNSLQLLYENKIINNGDRITLLTRAKLKNQNLIFSNATIHIENDKAFVRWDYDNKVYSISKLTYMILTMYGELKPQTIYYVNGSMYWGLSGNGKSLFSLAKTLRR